MTPTHLLIIVRVVRTAVQTGCDCEGESHGGSCCNGARCSSTIEEGTDSDSAAGRPVRRNAAGGHQSHMYIVVSLVSPSCEL